MHDMRIYRHVYRRIYLFTALWFFKANEKQRQPVFSTLSKKKRALG